MGNYVEYVDDTGKVCTYALNSAGTYVEFLYVPKKHTMHCMKLVQQCFFVVRGHMRFNFHLFLAPTHKETYVYSLFRG